MKKLMVETNNPEIKKNIFQVIILLTSSRYFWPQCQVASHQSKADQSFTFTSQSGFQSKTTTHYGWTTGPASWLQ